MGIAIAATIAESTGEDTAEDMELLTNDHRVLMTWGWVNIKVRLSVCLNITEIHFSFNPVYEASTLIKAAPKPFKLLNLTYFYKFYRAQTCNFM